ncbi:prepilin-type N-terminal cleavage/methylation domain-containing protein [Planctomycetota bacterium]
MKTENREAGFTLLELIAVISIILMLAASLTVTVGNAIRVAREKATRVTIDKLELGLHEYAAEHQGGFPPSHRFANGALATFGSNFCGIQALCSYLFVAGPGQRTPYLQSKEFDGHVKYRSDGTVDYIMDAWGTPLFYYRPGAPGRNGDTFDLFSCGPDRQTPAKAYDHGGAVTHDYLTDIPWEFASGAMQPAPGPTGHPGELPEFNPVAADIDAAMDDLGNFRLPWRH